MKNEDIVSRLRDIATLRGPMSGHVIPTTCLEAANEIENLRLELAQTRSDLQRVEMKYLRSHR